MEENYQKKKLENKKIDTQKISIKSKIQEIYKETIMNAM